MKTLLRNFTRNPKNDILSGLTVALALVPEAVAFAFVAGVDPLAVNDIKNIIGHLKRRGIGVLISDHNVRDTLGVCDKAYILCDGQVIESGSPQKIANSEAACRVYLGNEFKL